MSLSTLTNNQTTEISEVLTSFGFNKKDQDVYLGLLTLGQTTLTPLSNKLSLPLTTVQSTIQRLQQKGVVSVSKRKSRQVYEAMDPIVFKDILKEQAKGIAGILPILQTLKTDEVLSPKVRVFQRESLAEVFNDSLNCKSGLVYEIVSAKEFQKVIGEKFHYSRRRVKKGVQLKSLRVRSKEIKKYSASKHKRELREARFLPRDLDFDGSISFWDDTVVFFSTKAEGVHVMITSKSLREMMEQIFNLLWSVSGVMDTGTDHKKTVK